MHLAHLDDPVASLRHPTAADPWRILISGCLMGLPVGVDATSNGADMPADHWLRTPLVRLVPFCPEDTGIGTPRPMPDLDGGDGRDVLAGRARVLGPDGEDLTAGMLTGARAMARRALEERVDLALLMDRSAACGTQVVSLGCRFVEPVRYRRGVGVAAAALLEAGIPVVSQRDHRALGLLRAALHPSFTPDPTALDHHRHPWVLANLPDPAV